MRVCAMSAGWMANGFEITLESVAGCLLAR